MAYSSAELSATELALFAADKPILGANVISKTPTYARWTVNGEITGADITDSLYPSIRAYDGFANWATKPNTTGTTFYYVIQFSSALEFDFLGILGNNFGSCLPDYVRVDIADNGAFTSNMVTLAQWNAPTDNTRLINWAIYHTGAVARRYSNVPFLRVLFYKATGAGSFTPQFNELVVGRRRQLKTNPLEPYDDAARNGEMDRSKTSGGVIYKTIYSNGRYDLNCIISTHETAYQTDLTSFWSNCRNGEMCFVWCPLPTTSPDSWYYMDHKELSFQFPKINFSERQYPIEAEEQGSESYYLSSET